MLLPSLAVRAALRLNTPAKRFAWAAEQLHAALFPSPALAVDTVLGIPAKPAIKGIPATNVLSQIAAARMYADTKTFEPQKFSAQFYLPFDLVQYRRGVPLLLCVGQMSTEVYQPHVGTIATGEPVLDISVMKTFEQYLVEQLSLMITSTPNVDFNSTCMDVDVVNWFTSEYLSSAVPSLIIKTVLNRSGFVNNNRYADITGIATI